MNTEQATPCEKTTSWGTDGMALRDYFAAKAMAAYASDHEWRTDMDNKATAKAAYSMADAMLEAR